MATDTWASGEFDIKILITRYSWLSLRLWKVELGNGGQLWLQRLLHLAVAELLLVCDVN
jgi:hypothetical protein